MHAARAKVALSKIYRYSLLDANGDNTGIEVLCVAEYIAYTLQIGWKPDIRIEYPCGKCEKICPQHISIRKELKRVSKKFEPLPVRMLMSIVRWVLGR